MQEAETAEVKQQTARNQLLSASEVHEEVEYFHTLHTELKICAK